MVEAGGAVSTLNTAPPISPPIVEKIAATSSDKPKPNRIMRNGPPLVKYSIHSSASGGISAPIDSTCSSTSSIELPRMAWMMVDTMLLATA